MAQIPPVKPYLVQLLTYSERENIEAIASYKISIPGLKQCHTTYNTNRTEWHGDSFHWAII